MNLIVDIGNSSVKLAVFNGNDMLLRQRVGEGFEQIIRQTVETYSITACAYSVVGEAPAAVQSLLQQFPNALHITGNTPTPLVCDYRTPHTLGADRLAAAVGAAHCSPGSPLLIVDAGTCITYDYVSAEGHYLGGNISPGLGMRLRALHEQTAQLPLVSADGALKAIGQTTDEAIRAGVVLGMDYEIKGYMRQFQQQHAHAVIYLTGGNGYRFAREAEVERNDALVEIGLNCILNYAKA